MKLCPEGVRRVLAGTQPHESGTKRGARRTQPGPRAFTLVELLTVITIIGILIALLLPAVQAAREAARNTECQNHLKQWGMAALDHESATGRFPTNGWFGGHVGEPDRGDSWQQRGGWMYNLLPYMEQQSLHDLQLGKAPWSSERVFAATQMIQTPLGVLHCPSRRPAVLYPNGATYNPYYSTTTDGSSIIGTHRVDGVAKNDYAGNGGDVYCNYSFCGSYNAVPGLIAEKKFGLIAANATGVVYPGSQVKMVEIQDGTSNTYLFGEKFVWSDQYFAGTDPWYFIVGDDTAALVGDNHAIVRWTGINHTPDLPPRQDSPSQPGLPDPDWYRFGSPHGGGCNMDFCDGSVRSISYSIDPETHRRLGNRRDGEVIDAGKY
jgi:prepilin-type N-terminal cleavage/methylation domain-containing protein/prepilin-type processing-associated H-X9-DG protein